MACRKVASVEAVGHDLFAEGFVAHLLNSVKGKQSERLRHGNRRDTGVFAIADVGHLDDLLWLLERQMMHWIEPDVGKLLFDSMACNDWLE